MNWMQLMNRNEKTKTTKGVNKVDKGCRRHNAGNELNKKRQMSYLKQ